MMVILQGLLGYEYLNELTHILYEWVVDPLQENHWHLLKVTTDKAFIISLDYVMMTTIFGEGLQWKPS